MQGGWGIVPAVITTRETYRWSSEDMDLGEIFDDKSLDQSIKLLVDWYTEEVKGKEQVRDIKFDTERDYDNGETRVRLIGKYEETDAQLAQRHKNLLEQQGAKEAKELLEYQRLHTKFGDIFGK